MNKNPNLSQKPIAPEIVAETDDYLVINKPAGLAVHAGGNLNEATLADWLLSKYPKIAAVGDDPIRPGIVHRLDKEVSGLMVIAKNQKSFTSLKNQFKTRTINKEYLALAHGRIEADSGIINFPITRSQSGHRMSALPIGTSNLLTRRSPRPRDQGNIHSWFKAKTAETEFIVEKKFVNFTLLRIKIKTGRTHQIRVHLFAYGHPLAGDPLYNTKKSAEKNKKIALGRVWLVADRLSFKDLSETTQNFSLSLPKDLAQSLPKH